MLKNNEKGAIAVLLTLLIMGITLLIAFGISVIFVNEIKNSNVVSRSAPAFYAADAGAEYALYQIIKVAPGDPAAEDGNEVGVPLYGATSYDVCWGDDCDPDCIGVPNCINSTGKNAQTRRKIELTW